MKRTACFTACAMVAVWIVGAAAITMVSGMSAHMPDPVTRCMYRISYASVWPLWALSPVGRVHQVLVTFSHEVCT